MQIDQLTGGNSVEKAKLLARQIQGAALQGSYMAPGSLQGYVQQGQSLAIQTSQDQITALKAKQEEDRKKQQAEFNRAQARNLEQIRQASRSLDQEQDKVERGARTDAYKINKTPTRQQTFNEEQASFQDQYDDRLDDLREKLRQTNKRIQDAQKLLALPGFVGEQRTQLQERFEKDQDYAKSLQGLISKTETLKKQGAEEAKKFFDHNEALVKQTDEFEKRANEISLLQAELNKDKTIAKTLPQDPQALEVPRLERLIGLKQESLELDKQIQGIREKQYTNKYSDNKVGDEQIKQLEERSKLVKQNIEILNQQADAEQKAQTKKFNLDISSAFLSVDNELRKAQLDSTNAREKNKPLAQATGRSDRTTITQLTTNPLILQNKIDVSNTNQQYEEEKFKYEELARQGKLGKTFEENQANLTKILDKLKQIRDLKLDNLSKELDRALDARRVENLQKELTKFQKSHDLFTTPTENATKAQADYNKLIGGNQFTTNALMRPVARQQENYRYQQERMQTGITIEQLKAQGMSFSPEQIKEMYINLDKIHNINLKSVDQQFKSFGTTLGDIAKQGVNSIGDGLSELITKGGDAAKILDNIFGTILSSVFKQGISSLLGGFIGGNAGLFYDGGIAIANYAGGGLIDNITEAAKIERSQSGKKPVLIMAHEGELQVPAKRVQELAASGITPKKILGYAAGGLVNSNGEYGAGSHNASRSQDLNVHYTSTEIMGQKYVTEEQFQEGIKKAALEGASRGAGLVQNKMVNSPSFRRSMGF